jgi:predicted NBD/HSP70 family sugar kinase
MERVLDARLPEAAADAHRARGSSQSGMREYNERVVLQAIRLHGGLPAAEIARLTRLTAQTVSMITKQMTDEGLLIRLAPLRGRIGQPSVPLALNPDGAYAVGIEVRRRGMEQLLVDFTGNVRERRAIDYAFPDPDTLGHEIDRGLSEVRRTLGTERCRRVRGVGIAAPLSLEGWRDWLAAPPSIVEKWQRTDLRAQVASLTEWPVHHLKDTAAASIAELVVGRGGGLASFLYIFIDTLVGGGLVLDGQWRGGVHGNAGAVGSMSVGIARGGPAPAQLLNVASLINLERLYAAAGLDTSAARDARALEGAWAGATRLWMGEAAAAMGLAIHSAACLLDLDGVIIDGCFDRGVLAALVPQVVGALELYAWEGVARPRVLAGTVGADARAIGGALLPLYADFAPDPHLFLKVEH